MAYFIEYISFRFFRVFTIYFILYAFPALAVENERPLEVVQEPKLLVYMHVCTINHWHEVVSRQLARIEASGLYDACGRILIGVLGNEDLSEFKIKYPKVRFLFEKPEITEYERPTLLAIQKTCIKYPNRFFVLYLHSKGVSRPKDEEMGRCIADWVDYMEYFLIEKWVDCVQALKDYDACGVNWNGSIFEGNFWWARSSYISTLPRKIGSKYLDPEFWLGLNHPSVKCFHQSNHHGYSQRYPRSEYASEP